MTRTRNRNGTDGDTRWPDAEWVSGRGTFAVLAHCPSSAYPDGRDCLTVTLWPTLADAQKAKRQIDLDACGSGCVNRHEIVNTKDET